MAMPMQMKALTLREVTRQLRELHASRDLGWPAYAELVEHAGTLEFYAKLTAYDVRGAEPVPPQTEPFDAVAAARRLLAAWRDAQGGSK